jgi:hypothetical protein
MNDDQLTADLNAAFRSVTADLTYAGEAPRLRRNPIAAVPMTAAAAGIAAVALVPSLAGSPTAAPPSSPSSSTTSEASGPVRLVTETVSFAGATYAVTRDPSTQGPLTARVLAALPGGLEPVDIDSTGRVWTGTEPTTGEPAVVVESPVRFEGRAFSLSGAGWTAEQLVDVVRGVAPLPEIAGR